MANVSLVAPSGVNLFVGPSGTRYSCDIAQEISIPASSNDLIYALSAGWNFVTAVNARNNFAATGAPQITDDSSLDYGVGSRWVNVSGGTVYTCVDATAGAAVWVNAAASLLAQGVAAGYKIARGVHTQVAASDTVVTGLATVVAVTVSFQSTPTIKQLFCTGGIGNQAGAPAAGSILIKTFKPTAVNDVTPIAASDFTDNLGIAWTAVGT